MAAGVIGVIGASGGLGASTLAAALTRRVSVRQGACVLVDLDLGGGGAEVTTAVEHREGVRWVDLRDVVGSVDAARLVDALPGVEGAGVLSAGGRGPVRRADVPLAACRDVLDSLLGSGIPLVLDLPRSLPGVEEVAAQCSELALLTGLHTRALADLDALVERLESGWGEAGVPRGAGVISRGRRVSADVVGAIEQHLGVPHLAHVVDDRRVALACERGEWPGSARDGLRAIADLLLDRGSAVGAGSEPQGAAS